MTEFDIDVGRLNIAVSGVSSEVVREAAAGMEEELRRVLSSLSFAGDASVSISRLDLDPIEVTARVGAPELRELIADRLGASLRRAHGGGDG